MMDQVQLNKFLGTQKYMTIAVTLDDATPWAIPVRIKSWKGESFEWDSKLDAEHSKSILARQEIAISIWTPESDDTIQFGFYAKAKAELVSDENGFGRFRATVTECWINDASFKKRVVEII